MPRERAKERACDKAIRRTLAYRAVFKYPLTYHQLYTTLISREKFDKDLINKELAKMVKKGYIGYREGKYYLKNIKPVSWDFRYKHSKQVFDRMRVISRVLSAIPWIKMLCVTGSAAAFNSDRESDIDIFVVAKTHRLWLTRGFVSLLLKVMNVYAQAGIGPNKVCPNLFIDEEVLDWPTDQRSVFVAHEIALMHPLINRGNTYFKFVAGNNWVNEYFCNFAFDWEHKGNDVKRQKGSRLVNLLEKMAKKFQLDYMKKKRTNEVIEDHMIHFKKNDNTKWILDEFAKLGRHKESS